MTNTPPQTETHVRFQSLLEDLQWGRECAVGDWLIEDTRRNSENPEWFTGKVFDPHSKTISEANIHVSLSTYENLMGGKVDITVEGLKLNVTETDLSFTTHAERFSRSSPVRSGGMTLE